uniref:Uncharacterized protein n=1 Tax=Triticum urartu TaxID=4572 RepID=A0A8R7Q1C6_TRIUA
MATTTVPCHTRGETSLCRAEGPHQPRRDTRRMMMTMRMSNSMSRHMMGRTSTDRAEGRHQAGAKEKDDLLPYEEAHKHVTSKKRAEGQPHPRGDSLLLEENRQ